MKNDRTNRRAGPAGRGFTLIELLVSVAIIAVLLAMLVPCMGRGREQARRTVCASNLRQVGNGIYNYWTEWNGRVPWVWGPMTNNYYGKASIPDSAVDPYDRATWPDSLPNVLMPTHLAETPRLFVCPSARAGWPRQGGALRYTYREASANQPNGAATPEGSYQREHFGFLDGRYLMKLRLELTGDPVKDAMLLATLRGMYIRDLIVREGDAVFGPHDGGIMCLNRDMQVQFRNRQTVEEDLGLNGAGSKF